jgi:hypothetical protein
MKLCTYILAVGFSLIIWTLVTIGMVVMLQKW